MSCPLNDYITPSLLFYIFYLQVQCSHLLVKHAGSRRPSSWREETITRSKDEAIEILNCEFILLLDYLVYRSTYNMVLCRHS